jgi:hypothetical protein
MQCTGKSKRSGKQCENNALVGSDKCRMHDGRKKVDREQRAMEARAEMLAAKFAVPIKTDPITALVHSLYEREGNVAYYRAEVMRLDSHWSATKHLTGEYTGETKVHAAVELYERALKAREDLSLNLLKADVEQRKVRIVEAQAQQVVAFARGLMTDLGIDPLSPEARAAFRKHLELIAGQQEDIEE